MTDKELAEIRARCEAATKGPWVECRNGGGDDFLYSIDSEPTGLPIVKADCGVYPPEKEDADFIAHAREDIPKLLAEVERLRKQVAELDAECDDLAMR